MNLTDIQDSIFAKLQALGVETVFDVYETDIPVGTNRPNKEHAISPYVLIDFGNPGQVIDQDYKGIVGTRADLKYLSIIFEIVSNNPATTRQIAGIVNDAFEGYVPHETWGEMVARVAAPMYTRQAPEGGEFYPPRYYRTIAYVVDVNA